MSIVFDLERTNQLSLLPDKDLVDLCPPIEPYQVTKNQFSLHRIDQSLCPSCLCGSFPSPGGMYLRIHFTHQIQESLVRPRKMTKRVTLSHTFGSMVGEEM
jgi:hypothetical protein